MQSPTHLLPGAPFRSHHSSEHGGPAYATSSASVIRKSAMLNSCASVTSLDMRRADALQDEFDASLQPQQRSRHSEATDFVEIALEPFGANDLTIVTGPTSAGPARRSCFDALFACFRSWRSDPES